MDQFLDSIMSSKSSLPFLEQARKQCPESGPENFCHCVTQGGFHVLAMAVLLSHQDCCFASNVVAWIGLEMLRHPGEDQLLSNVYVESSLACSMPVACSNGKKSRLKKASWRFLIGNIWEPIITHLSFKLLPYLPSTAVAFARLGLTDRMSPRPRFLHWHSRLSARAPHRNVAQKLLQRPTMTINDLQHLRNCHLSGTHSVNGLASRLLNLAWVVLSNSEILWNLAISCIHAQCHINTFYNTCSCLSPQC